MDVFWGRDGRAPSGYWEMRCWRSLGSAASFPLHRGDNDGWVRRPTSLNRKWWVKLVVKLTLVALMTD